MSLFTIRGRRSSDRLVVGFKTTCAISVYHRYSCEFESRSWWGVIDTTLCEKVWQWLATGRWIYPSTSVSSTNKTDHHDITEILLKVALNTITLTLTLIYDYNCNILLPVYSFVNTIQCVSFEICHLHYCNILEYVSFLNRGKRVLDRVGKWTINHRWHAAILQYNGILLCRTNVESTHCKSYWSTVINRKYNQEEI
jgi:hypothetical protein